MHEKERELFDCLRLIIQNGYELREQDMSDILHFVQIHELFCFDAKEQRIVTQFLRESAELLGFDPAIIDRTLAEVQDQTSMVLHSQSINASGDVLAQLDRFHLN